MSDTTLARSEAIPVVLDPFGRPVRSMRVSVTQRCSLACDYCHKEGQAPATEEMMPEEIRRIVGVAVSLGVRKVKITGGEPLMREDLAEIVEGISPMLSEVSLTTNGHGLDEAIGRLKRAGLKRINVSLHSLDPEVYGRLCGTDGVDSVVRGIESAVEAGLTPVKVNMVVIKGFNDREIPRMMDFCAKAGAILQLIEYETSKEDSKDSRFKDRYFSLADTERDLASRADSVAHNELHGRRRYTVRTSEGKVEVEFVRPMHNSEFCRNCTRIRLSSDGHLKPCLLDRTGELDALGMLRKGASDPDLRDLFLSAVAARRPYWS